MADQHRGYRRRFAADACIIFMYALAGFIPHELRRFVVAPFDGRAWAAHGAALARLSRPD
ncbi:MAG: hypothetical protein SFV21_05835 [Rhodospirillaceae bacterium]|nr:hypothetical protein [Rhodospirillaceae bacterium]